MWKSGLLFFLLSTCQPTASKEDRVEVLWRTRRRTGEENREWREGEEGVLTQLGDTRDGCKWVFQESSSSPSCCYSGPAREDSLCHPEDQGQGCRTASEYRVEEEVVGEDDQHLPGCTLHLISVGTQDSGTFQAVFPASPEDNINIRVTVEQVSEQDATVLYQMKPQNIGQNQSYLQQSVYIPLVFLIVAVVILIVLVLVIVILLTLLINLTKKSRCKNERTKGSTTSQLQLTTYKNPNCASSEESFKTLENDICPTPNNETTCQMNKESDVEKEIESLKKQANLQQWQIEQWKWQMDEVKRQHYNMGVLAGKVQTQHDHIITEAAKINIEPKPVGEGVKQALME